MGEGRRLRAKSGELLTDGQQAAGSLNYAPLPDAVKQQNVQTLNQMTVNGSAIQ